MEEHPYIQIGNNRYPIHINTPISTMDEPSPSYTTPPPVAQFKRSWSNTRNRSGAVTWDTVELTEHGSSLFQEYLASGQCDITISYTSYFRTQTSSRRRNTRVQKVQVKRRTLDLSHDGKCCSLRTRKASVALRKAEQQWYDGKRAEQPVASEFERISPRVQRKQARDARRFYRSFGSLKDYPNYFDLGEFFDREIAHAFIVPDGIEEQYNG